MSLTPASDALRADHRRIEVPLDALLAALRELTANRFPELRRNRLTKPDATGKQIAHSAS